MIRNEKSGRFEAPAKEAEYGYYSKLLGKPFDSVEELKEAEEAHRKAEEEKKQASLAKKADASKVEEAWKSLNAARRDYNEKVVAAKKEYLQAVADAQKKYQEAVKGQDAALDEARDAYDEALSEFNKAHPEGYHVTLKDGDSVKTIARSSFYDDWFDRVFDSFFRF